MSKPRATGSQESSGCGCAGSITASARARNDQAHHRPRAGAAPLLCAVVVAAALGYASLEPAEAQTCSRNEAARIAEDRYGGEALRVSVEGDYLIVRLRLGDGRIIDVAIYEREC